VANESCEPIKKVKKVSLIQWAANRWAPALLTLTDAEFGPVLVTAGELVDAGRAGFWK